MERPSVLREFSRTLPIRAGPLYFPPVAASILKKKGILEKAGEYFSKETKERFSLLVKITLPKDPEPGEETLYQKYKEQKVLWTWDQSTASCIKSHLKSRAKGLCRHTRDILEKKKHNEKETIGICSRSECANITLEILLMEYLKQPLLDSERDALYVDFLKQFPPKEYILYDPDVYNFRQGKIIVKGIHKRTVRHFGNSNGIRMDVFSIIFNAASSVEAVKNLVRPMLLNAKRGSVNREHILLHIGHTSHDTLNEWWKDIHASVRGYEGNGWNEELKDIYVTDAKDLGRDAEGGEIFLREERLSKTKGKPSRPEKVKKFELKESKLTNVVLYGDPRTQADYGVDSEVVTAEFTTPLSFKHLFEYLDQTQNSMEIQDNFERFLFGSAVADTGVSEVESLQVIVNPPNGWGKSLEKYGRHKQLSYVRAITKGPLPKNWVHKNWPSDLQSAVGYVTNSLLNLVRKEPVDVDRRTGESTLRRCFLMEKGFYVDYADAEEKHPERATFVWGQAKELAGLSKSKLKEFEKGDAKAAKIDQIMISFEKSKPKVLIEGQSAASFSSLLLNQPGKAKQLLNSKALATKMNSKAFDDSVVAGKALMFMKALSKDQKTGARLNYLGGASNLLDAVKTKEDYSSEEVNYVKAELANGVREALYGSRNIVVIQQGFKLFREILTYGKYSQKKHKLETKHAVFNHCLKQFMKTVDIIMLNSFSLFELEVVSEGLGVIEYLLKKSDSCIPRVTLDMVTWFDEIVCNLQKKLLKGAESREQFEFNKVQSKLKELKVRWFHGYTAINNLQRRKKLVQFKSLYEIDEDSSELRDFAIPYVSKKPNAVGSEFSLEWHEAVFKTKDKTFLMENELKMPLEKFEKINLAIPEKQQMFVYIETCNANNAYDKKTPEKLVPSMTTLRTLSDAIVKAEQAETKVYVRLCGNAGLLFGTENVYNMPVLGETWAKSILQGIETGLLGYHENRACSVKERTFSKIDITKVLDHVNEEVFKQQFCNEVPQSFNKVSQVAGASV